LAPITERIGRRRALLLAYALYAASMLSVLWLPSVEWMVLPAVLFGLGNGLNIPTLSSWLAASVDRDVRAGIMALNSVALRGGQTLGPLVAGAGFAMAGIEGAFATGVIVAILLAGLSVLLGPGKLDTPRTS
jgi:MFS family permease